MTTETDVISLLTAKDDTLACAYAERIVSESRKSDLRFRCFDEFASLMNHPKSLVRNRALTILAANAKWDTEGRFASILPEYLSAPENADHRAAVRQGARGGRSGATATYPGDPFGT